MHTYGLPFLNLDKVKEYFTDSFMMNKPKISTNFVIRYLMDDIIFLLKFGHSNILTEYIIVPTTNAYTIFYSDFNSNVYHKHSFTFKFIKILKPVCIKDTNKNYK